MSFLPNIYGWLKASPDVVAILGGNPRVYEHGAAPQGVVAPYVTHRAVSGIPANCLDDSPPIDKVTMMVDIWSDNAGSGSAGVKDLATAVRGALEAHGHQVDFSAGRDFETQRYRVSMIFDFWHDRPPASS